MEMACLILKGAVMFLLCEGLCAIEMSETGSIISTTTTSFLSENISVEVDELQNSTELMSLSSNVRNPLTVSTTLSPTPSSTSESVNLDHLILPTEPVRHSLGRGFPVPHYHLPESRGGPFFEEGAEPHNISARIGSTVTIDCRIGLLQNKTVTWLHHKGDSIHLLTVGRSAYSSDERITLSLRYPNNFRLQIIYLTRRDEGLYECQVATHPPKVKRIFLKVTAPEVRIVDESNRVVTERYYKAGSALELTCLASQIGGSTEHYLVTWRHGNHLLSKGISSNVSLPTDSVVSTLTVAPLEKLHSGNYTCAIGTLAFATVAVHVLNGELPAAVHHGNAAASRFVGSTMMILLATSSLLFWRR